MNVILDGYFKLCIILIYLLMVGLSLYWVVIYLFISVAYGLCMIYD